VYQPGFPLLAVLLLVLGPLIVLLVVVLLLEAVLLVMLLRVEALLGLVLGRLQRGEVRQGEALTVGVALGWVPLRRMWQWGAKLEGVEHGQGREREKRGRRVRWSGGWGRRFWCGDTSASCPSPLLRPLPLPVLLPLSLSLSLPAHPLLRPPAHPLAPPPPPPPPPPPAPMTLMPPSQQGSLSPSLSSPLSPGTPSTPQWGPWSCGAPGAGGGAPLPHVGPPAEGERGRGQGWSALWESADLHGPGEQGGERGGEKGGRKEGSKERRKEGRKEGCWGSLTSSFPVKGRVGCHWVPAGSSSELVIY